MKKIMLMDNIRSNGNVGMGEIGRYSYLFPFIQDRVRHLKKIKDNRKKK
jgi:hypothetical protein